MEGRYPYMYPSFLAAYSTRLSMSGNRREIVLRAMPSVAAASDCAMRSSMHSEAMS